MNVFFFAVVKEVVVVVLSLTLGSGLARVRLIEGGAFSHACFCREGRAPIHFAVLESRSSCLELLIAKNADLNVRDK